MAHQTRRTRLSGHDVCLVDTGPGPDAVVLVHGIGGSRRYFDPLVRVLAADRRVLAPDLPGFGSSPGLRRALSVEEHATVLEELVLGSGLERPVLLGHSMFETASANAIMMQTDATLVALAAERDVNTRVTTVHSRWDPHIPAGSGLEGAVDVELDVPGHFRALQDPRLREVVLDAVRCVSTRQPEQGGSPARPSTG